jgi:lysophospholipase L1-like esterase
MPSRRLFLAALAAALAVPAGTLSAAAPTPVRILLLGDSTTIGSVCREVEPKADALEAVIRKELAAVPGLPPAEVINQGRNGETAAGLVGRFDKDIAPLAKQGPVDVVLIRYGINDRNRLKDFANAFPQDYRKLLGKLRADFPNARIVPVTIIPYMGEQRDTEVNDLIKSVAKAENLPLFDIYPAYAAELKKRGPNSLNYRRVAIDKIPEPLRAKVPAATKSKDGKSLVVMGSELDETFKTVPNWFGDRHPNVDGYRVIGVETAKFLVPLLKEKAKP